ALAELDQHDWHGAIEKPEGRGSANAGTVHGGTGSNVVMPALHILAEARSHDPGFRRAIVAAWQDAFRRAAEGRRNRRGQSGRVCFGPGPTYEAYALGPDAPVVRAVLTAAARVGLAPQCRNDDGGNDANWLVAHGIPTVTIGCGQRHVHMPEEEVNLAEFTR